MMLYLSGFIILILQMFGSTELRLKHDGFDMHLKHSNGDVPQELKRRQRIHQRNLTK